MSAPLIPVESVRRHRLDNGLTLLVRRDASAPVVAIVTWVRAGYFDESDEQVGIAHVLEHMYFKGTHRLGVGEIARQTKAAGGYLNAGTIYDHTSYYTVLPATSFDRGLELQADAFADSVIDATELARELEVIIQEAKRKADNPSAVTVETLYELLHDRHRIGRWRIGREAGLRRLTRADVLGFYRTMYRPRETILSIVGDVDPDRVVGEVERRYGSLEDVSVTRDTGPTEPAHDGFRYRELSGDVTQTQIAFGWRTPGTAHPDTPLLDLAAVVLGAGRASRLYRGVRERRLVASISAHNYTPTALGVFTTHAEGPPDRAVAATAAMWSEVQELRGGGVREEELVRARQLFESRWIRRLESMEGQANYLAEWEALGEWALGERYLETILAATPSDVDAAVRRHLGPGNAGLTVFRPAREASFIPNVEDAPGVLAALSREDGEPRRNGAVPSAPAAATVARTSPSSPRRERVEAGVDVFRTPRGVPILVRRRGTVPLVHIGVYASGGACDEPANRAGLTSLLARTAIKGTDRRTADQIAEESELLGGSISSVAGSESFGWGLSVPSKHLDKALDLLGDVVQHPVIPDEAFETERTLALADLALLRDDMHRYPLRLLGEAAFAGHPYGVPASGTDASLPTLDAALVRAWHRERLIEGEALVAIMGDVSPDAAAAAASRMFGDLRGGVRRLLEAPQWPVTSVRLAESRSKAQTALAMGFPSPSREDDARFAARILAGIASGLGGRFFDALREQRSLAYTVSAFSSERRLAGMFVSYIATSPELEETARQGLLEQFALLRESPVTDRELEQAKAYALGTQAIRLQSGAAVLGDIADAWLFGRGLGELEEFDARVLAVTAGSIQDLAKSRFDPDRVVEGLVRGVGKEV